MAEFRCSVARVRRALSVGAVLVLLASVVVVSGDEPAGAQTTAPSPPEVVLVPVPDDPCVSAVATIEGTPGDDVLVGTPGDDVIIGGAGNDIIEGLEGNDVLCGGPGEDNIVGNEGADRISGGDDDDVIGGGMGDDVILGGSGADTVEGKFGQDQIFGGAGNDNLAGNEENDIVVGGDGADTLGGGKGDDLILGGAGDDVIDGKTGADLIFGEGGNDDIVGSEGPDVIAGGPGDDIIGGGKQADELFGQAGNDTIAGKAGDDYLDGGDDVDSLDGDGGSDVCDDGETNTECEEITQNGDGDSTPPAVSVAVDNQLATTGELELTLTASDAGSGIATLLLASPDGYVYDVTNVSATEWTATIDAERLFPEQAYDFVFIVEDGSGNASVTETVSIVVPDRPDPIPVAQLEVPPGLPLDDLLADIAATGVQPFEFIHTRTVADVSELPADLAAYLAENPGEASSFVGRTFSGVATVNQTPLSLIPDTYNKLLVQQGATGSPVITGIRVIAPSEATLSSFEAASGAVGAPAVAAAPATAPQFVPGGDPLAEPFWPTFAALTWSDNGDFRVDDWQGCETNPFGCAFDDLFGDGFGVDFQGRSIRGVASGLDTYFRPYFNAYTDRAYEFDVAQLNLTQVDDLDAEWVQNFGGSSGVDVLGPVCAGDLGDNFPLARHEVETIMSHDFAALVGERNGVEFSLFETNVNPEAQPYPDSYVGDPCQEMDLSLGIARPDQLDPSLTSLTYSFTGYRGTVDEAGLGVEHQSLDRHPGGESTKQAIGCETWSSGGSGLGGLTGLFGTNFCVGVVTAKTRSVMTTTNSERVDSEDDNRILQPNAPWMPISFSTGPNGACFLVNVPDEDFASAPWQIRYGLAESVASCGFNRPTSGYLRITSEQILPGLVEGEPYRYQLEVASANPVIWDVLDDPLARYGPKDFVEGLPAGLSLDPSTGEITGTPLASTSAASPAYATVRATTSASSAVKQIVFGDPAVNDLVAHAAELPVAVPVDSFVSVSDLLVTETGYWAVEHSYSDFDGFIAQSSLPALFRVSPDLGTINQVTLSGFSNTQLAGLQGDRVVQFEEHADSETYLRIIDSTGGIVSHVVGRSSNETFFDMAASVTTGHIILSYQYTDGSGRVAVYDPTTNAVVHELTLPLPHRLEASGDRVLLTPPPLDDGPILVLDLTDPAFVNSPVTLANPTAGYRWAAADDNSGVFWFQPVGAGDTVEVLDPASTTTAPHPLPAGLGSSLLEAASSNHVVFTATPESPNPQLVAALALVPVDLEGNLGLHPLGVLDIPVELFKGNDSTDGIPRVWAVPGPGTALFGTSYRRTVGSDADGFYPSLQALNMAAFDGGVLN